MYMTQDEDAAIALTLDYAKRNFRYYQHAPWFTGWDTVSMRDGVLRGYISDKIRVDRKPSAAYFTALAKYHHSLPHDERYVVVSDIPPHALRRVLIAMMRTYRDRYYDYAGAWRNTSNEVIMTALASLSSSAPAFPAAVFAGFIANVKTQVQTEGIGTCTCGLRALCAPCCVCGWEG